ncbi:hypothetical protein CEXT_211941 [Caerostris extrusa]|uniref:Uncharacterized protein n=1 Tax=Caerostris extrusa TaxID=172846 RepID=A0AAV4MUJ2_CAEEX|nr:hypothetical protein CEXT_211941 [Caerostris extrusa]
MDYCRIEGTILNRFSNCREHMLIVSVMGSYWKPMLFTRSTQVEYVEMFDDNRQDVGTQPSRKVGALTEHHELKI